MFNNPSDQSSVPSINSISRQFESLKCFPIHQESLFNGTFVQYYQCANNNNRINLNVKVEISQDAPSNRH